MGAPIDPTPNYSIIEWVAGAVWAVAIVVAGVFSRIFAGLRRKISALEKTITTLEKNAAMIDHDLKGIRHNQIILEAKTEQRHRDNQQEWAELREFLGEEMRELRRRIDRLLERD